MRRRRKLRRRRRYEKTRRRMLLAGVGIFHAFVIAEEELSIKQLHSYHSKDEMEKDVDDEDVEDILQRVDDTVEDGLQLGHPLDRLQRPQDPENPQGLHHSKVFGPRASPEKHISDDFKMMILMTAHVMSMMKEVRAQETTMRSMQFHISRMYDPGCRIRP